MAGAQAHLLLQLAAGALLGGLAGVDAAGGELPHPGVDGVAVLAHEDDPAVGVDGQRRHRPPLADHLAAPADAPGLLHVVDVEVEDVPAVDALVVEDPCLLLAHEADDSRRGRAGAGVGGGQARESVAEAVEERGEVGGERGQELDPLPAVGVGEGEAGGVERGAVQGGQGLAGGGAARGRASGSRRRWRRRPPGGRSRRGAPGSGGCGRCGSGPAGGSPRRVAPRRSRWSGHRGRGGRPPPSSCGPRGGGRWRWRPRRSRARGWPWTRARYSFSTSRVENWRTRARWVGSSLATTRRPDVPLSRRWTMPGRRTPPTPERSVTWRRSALTRVPSGVPAPGWTTRPAGLSTTMICGSSWTTERGMSSGSGSAGVGGGSRTATVCPGLQAGGRPRRRPRRRDVALGDERLEARPAELGQPSGEPDVETQARGLGVGHEGVLGRHQAWLLAGPRELRRGGSDLLRAVQAGQEDGHAQEQHDGDQLGGRERPAEPGPPVGVAAEELQDEAGGRVEPHVGQRSPAPGSACAAPARGGRRRSGRSPATRRAGSGGPGCRGGSPPPGRRRRR